MALYKRKPDSIEAIQWDGLQATLDQIQEWANATGVHNISVNQQTSVLSGIKGQPAVNVDDYILRGFRARLIVLPKDAFEAIYEPA